MTGLDIQKNLDAVVLDLQTKGKGQTVEMMFRNPDNSSNVLPLSSDAQGVVDVGQLSAIQTVVDALKDAADTYAAQIAPVTAAQADFKYAREQHQQLIDDASTARLALSDALFNDPIYQNAKGALDTARADVGYINASFEYKDLNTSENIAEISRAKGSYLA